jgi:hypothetical protein
LRSRGGIGNSWKRLDIRRLAAIVSLGVAVGVLWSHPFIKPLKILVVFFHEASHALMALATGGQVASMRVLLNESGEVLSMGGSPFWTLTAGYLGSLLLGGLVLAVASRTNLAKTVAALLGAGMAAMAVLYLRNTGGFLFGIGFGVALMLVGLALPHLVAEWVLLLIGVTSCLYAVYDIATDILLRPEAPSDARMLAELTGFPPFLSATGQTLVWGVLWMGIALLATARLILFSAGGKRRARGV